jgi:hypothetical protein
MFPFLGDFDASVAALDANMSIDSTSEDGFSAGNRAGWSERTLEATARQQRPNILGVLFKRLRLGAIRPQEMDCKLRSSWEASVPSAYALG